MFWDCHFDKMYFKPNQFFHVDFDNLIPQIRKKIREDFISLNRGNYFFFARIYKLSMIW